MYCNLLKYSKLTRLISQEVIYENSELKINSFLLKNKNENISIDEVTILEKSKSKLPVVLTISIEDVISRQFKNEKEADIYLSNLSQDDFYFQKTTAKKSITLSFIRRQQLDEILNIEILRPSQIIAINLGGGVLLDFLYRMNVPFSSLKCGPHYYNFSEPRWDYNFESNAYGNSKITLQNDELSENQVIPLISGLCVLEEIKAHEFLLKNEVEKNFQKVLFIHNSKRVLKPFLASVVFLLILHITLFSYLNSQKEILSEKHSAHLINFQLHEKLKTENVQLKQSLHSTQNNLEIPVSYLLDQIAKSKEFDIHFSRMIAFPKIKSSKNEEKNTHDMHKILIEGSAKNNQRLNSWSKNLGALDFLESISFNHLAGNNSKTTDFEIQLNIKK